MGRPPIEVTLAGLCSKCHENPRVKGSLCEECHRLRKERHADRARERAEEHVADGLCAECGKLNETENRYCSECITGANIQNKKAKDSGICTQCKAEPALTDQIYCEECAREHSIKSAERVYARKVATLMHYGGECVWCGESDPDVLNIDHINNDGAAHRKQLKEDGEHHLYSWLKKNDYPEGFQVLCCNCNTKKLRMMFREKRGQPEPPDTKKYEPFVYPF